MSFWSNSIKWLHSIIALFPSLCVPLFLLFIALSWKCAFFVHMYYPSSRFIWQQFRRLIHSTEFQSGTSRAHVCVRMRKPSTIWLSNTNEVIDVTSAVILGIYTFPCARGSIRTISGWLDQCVINKYFPTKYTENAAQILNEIQTVADAVFCTENHTFEHMCCGKSVCAVQRCVIWFNTFLLEFTVILRSQWIVFELAVFLFHVYCSNLNFCIIKIVKYLRKHDQFIVPSALTPTTPLDASENIEHGNVPQCK